MSGGVAASRAVEDYVKALYNLAETDPDDLTNAGLAARLGVTTASASAMVGRLTREGLVAHERYGAIELTDAGRALAVEVVRRHRVVETYLVQALGYTWDEVHDDAEALEHAVSATLLARLDAALGHPLRDPHGDPIPTPDGVVHQPESRPLLALAPGERGVVCRVLDDAELLRWLTAHGVGLDTEVEVVEQRPLGGPLVVRLGPGQAGRTVEFGLAAVGAVWVTATGPGSGVRRD